MPSPVECICDQSNIVSAIVYHSTHEFPIHSTASTAVRPIFSILLYINMRIGAILAAGAVALATFAGAEGRADLPAVCIHALLS